MSNGSLCVQAGTVFSGVQEVKVKLKVKVRLKSSFLINRVGIAH
jgi:hypothetical protein